MRRVPLKLLSSAIVAGLGAFALAGCGDELPDNAVAKVGDEVITRADYDKWRKFVVLSPFLEDESDALFKRETMETLIESEWVEQEAAAQDVTVSDQEVDRLWLHRKRGFPPKAYRQFLKDSGLAEEDLIYRVKVEQLQRKLEQAIAANEPKVSERDIAAYFEKNRKRFALPERHDFTFVLTKTKARAEQAKQALRSGASWDTVVKRYSTTPKSSKAQAVRGPKLSEGREALERAVYNSANGEIDGPVSTRFGWYVFEVTKVTPEAPASLAEVKDRIRAVLESRRRDAAVARFHEDYREQTVCADEFKAPECSNGPKEKSSS
jgi:parvulin-like peptidyl-prolyl isomerase